MSLKHWCAPCCSFLRHPFRDLHGMAGRGRAGRSGRGLIDDSAEPLMGGGLHTARRVPGFKNPFDDPGGMTPVADNHSIQGAGVGSPGAGVPSHDTLGRRSLGCAVMTGYALPAFSLRGVQAFAATHAVTRVYSGGDIVDHGRRDAGYVTMAAFGSLIVASYAQLIAAHFGDGLRTRLGRRRPVLAFLAPLNAVAAYLLVSPPEALEGNSAFYAIVFGLLMVFVEIATTMLDALGTEMSALQHPDARTTLFAAQTTAGIVGVGCASAAGLVIGFKPGDGIAAGMPRALVGIAIAVLLLLTHAVAVLTTHETPSSALPSKQFRRMRTSFVPGLRWIMRNSQWKIFMWATTPLNLIAELMAIVPAVYVYLLQCGEDEEMYERDDYQKGGCEQGEALRWASSAMIVYACGAAVSAGLLAPLLARRFNKLVTLRGFVLLAFFFSFFGLFAADKDNSRGVFLAFTVRIHLPALFSLASRRGRENSFLFPADVQLTDVSCLLPFRMARCVTVAQPKPNDRRHPHHRRCSALPGEASSRSNLRCSRTSSTTESSSVARDRRAHTKRSLSSSTSGLPSWVGRFPSPFSPPPAQRSRQTDQPTPPITLRWQWLAQVISTTRGGSCVWVSSAACRRPAP